MTETREIPGPMQTVGVMILNPERDKILLVKHKEAAGNQTDIYGFPAGRIELGEAPREAAVRELFEETGFTAKEEDLKSFEGNYFTTDLQRSNGDLRRANFTLYFCEVVEGELRDSDETLPEWVEISEINNLNTMPNIDIAIENFLKSEKNE